MDEYIVHPSYFDIRSKSNPTTPLEALMQCDFGEEPEESALERELYKEKFGPYLEKALDELEPHEREIVEGVVLEGLSLRRLAIRVRRPDGGYYGKTWIAHLRDEAFAKLRASLEAMGLQGCDLGKVSSDGSNDSLD